MKNKPFKELIKLIVQIFKQNIWKAVISGILVAYIPYWTTGNIRVLLINFAIVSLVALIGCMGVDFIKVTLFYNIEMKGGKK